MEFINLRFSLIPSDKLFSAVISYFGNMLWYKIHTIKTITLYAISLSKSKI